MNPLPETMVPSNNDDPTLATMLQPASERPWPSFLCFWHCNVLERDWFYLFPTNFFGLDCSGFLSLSCSHTTAFLRAVQHGCQHPHEGHKMEASKSNACWDLIQNGWKWLVLASIVEDQLQSAWDRCHEWVWAKHWPGPKMEPWLVSIAWNTGHFVQHHAGGQSFPLIAFLQRFNFLA